MIPTMMNLSHDWENISMHENRKKRQSTEEDSIGIIQVIYVSVDDCSGLFDR